MSVIISILLVMYLFLLIYIRSKIKKGIKLAKIDPFIIPKGRTVIYTPEMYDQRRCIVLNRNKQYYNLKDLATLKLYMKIHRNKLNLIHES